MPEAVRRREAAVLAQKKVHHEAREGHEGESQRGGSRSRRAHLDRDNLPLLSQQWRVDRDNLPLLSQQWRVDCDNLPLLSQQWRVERDNLPLLSRQWRVERDNLPLWVQQCVATGGCAPASPLGMLRLLHYPASLSDVERRGTQLVEPSVKRPSRNAARTG